VVISKKTFDDGAPIVKRVIAKEGQIVDIDFGQGIVYVDGLPLEEDYISTPTTVYEGVSFPVIVEEGCVFVLGDNRGVSKDSRSPEIGFVDKREILGKALFLLLPGTDHGKIQRDFGRIGVIIHE
jgi:signal peptidase I